ncbi:MAG: hypothetical protein HYY84_03755 [Deltaproteobacteria bacterium]|nr:hypothetical protein [Deltaproteobacteria bacterium]
MLTITVTQIVVTFAMGATEPPAAFEGRFATESIESSPALVQGSATLAIEREAGGLAFRASLVEMKSFGFEIPEPPDAIRLAGQLAPRNGVLQLIGSYKNAEQRCFLRLNVRTTARNSVLAAGWLDCGKKKIEIGFTAERVSPQLSPFQQL